MDYRPKPAGPKNIRELYHWIYGQLTSVGDAIGSGGGGGGLVDSVVGGTAITVNSTTPSAPVVNSDPFTGAGSIGHVPNPVTANGYFLSDDGTWQPASIGGVAAKWLWNDSTVIADPGLTYMRGNDNLMDGMTVFALSTTPYAGDPSPVDMQVGDLLIIFDEDHLATGRWVIQVQDKTDPDFHTISAIPDPGNSGNPLSNNVMDVVWIPQRGGGGYVRPTVLFTAATAFTLGATNENQEVVFTADTPITVTVPNDATDNLPVVYLTHLVQRGAGQITVTPAAGVTITSSRSLVSAAPGSALSLSKLGADDWNLVGDQE